MPDDEFLEVLGRDEVFFILGICIRIERNSEWILNDEIGDKGVYEDIDENTEDTLSMIRSLMNVFSVVLEDKEVEKEFIKYVFEHFNIIIPAAGEGVGGETEPTYDNIFPFPPRKDK